MRNMTLRILGAKLILVQIVLNFFLKFMIYDLGLPSNINYITDLITIIIFAIACISFKQGNNLKNTESILFAMLLFMIITFISAMLHGVAFNYYFLAFRATCRFLFFFFSCIVLLDEKRIGRLFVWLEIIMWINFPIMIYQFYILGIRSDKLNALFGTYVGGNAAILCYYTVLTVYYIMQYFSNKVTLLRMILVLGSMTIMCSLNELKFYYGILVILFILVFLLQRKHATMRERRKMITIIVLGFVGVFFAMRFFLYLYPGFQNFFNLDFLWEYMYERSYNSEKMLYVQKIPIMNRLTYFTIIPQYFFDSTIDWFFGIGMGTAEYGSIFHSVYGGLNYLGYSISYLLLENGILGLFLYLRIFYTMIRKYFKIRSDRSFTGKFDGISGFGIVLTIITVLMLMYNSALRIESGGYVMFAALAIPFVLGYGKQIWENSDDKINHKENAV